MLTHCTGDINEQYPGLFPCIAFTVVAMLIPESWILRPMLAMLGFGPEGPMAGALKPYKRARWTELDTQVRQLQGCKCISGGAR